MRQPAFKEDLRALESLQTKKSKTIMKVTRTQDRIKRKRCERFKEVHRHHGTNEISTPLQPESKSLQETVSQANASLKISARDENSYGIPYKAIVKDNLPHQTFSRLYQMEEGTPPSANRIFKSSPTNPYPFQRQP
ncbi:hypothetical protein AVEN_245934-1 [Araneus ventricosus]|uniref:Uncharacterized protein n=1 Tax=Araneus ventricosus TaxID=182803 RepID=A0A4Y2P5G8_ARAVE|nr:hypothetical protein AVEN_245934-1 [Araneus ventricosus]